MDDTPVEMEVSLANGHLRWSFVPAAQSRGQTDSVEIASMLLLSGQRSRILCTDLEAVTQELRKGGRR